MLRHQTGRFSKRCALVQAILRKIAGVVEAVSSLRVSCATHLPRMRGTTRSEFCAAPPPFAVVAIAVAAEMQLVLMTLQERGGKDRIA